MNRVFRGIGMMSGTSLDGLDIVSCEFWQENFDWKYKILKTSFNEYPEDLLRRLELARELRTEDILKLDIAYGRWLGKKVGQFVANNQSYPDFIASHGYTVFHQPQNGFTLQIGSGYEIFTQCYSTVIYDFRQLDVSLGGQGAPLVPIGDKLLFGEYEYCLNLGGIANISTELLENRVAYDISPVNMILNPIARKLGQSFDRSGNFASKGKIIPALFDKLESLDFYTKEFPKSLGSEWVEENIFSLTEVNENDSKDVLSTLVEHISTRIASDVLILEQKKKSAAPKMLVTGGGAKNNYLIERLKSKLMSSVELTIPNDELIDFKEALIFAFLGLLRLNNEPNCLSSVTGAKRNNSGGSVISDKLLTNTW